jgi:phosphatidylinositol kinase/protein kinase (PI-3  family)
LSSLHERFDKHLAQAENVRSLFIALNDESFQNRETAVGLIGRLAKHNPAYVMPSLRKALIQLLTELEYSTVLCVSYCLLQLSESDNHCVGEIAKSVPGCLRFWSAQRNG